jgi:hypothetical protein
MDDIENVAILLVCLLDETVFPQFLEWSNEQGIAKWVLLLLQTDYLRFRGLLSNLNPMKSKAKQWMHYIVQANSELPLLSEEEIIKLKRLNTSKIPFNSAFSIVCQHIWKVVVNKSRFLTQSKSWKKLQAKLLTESLTFLELDTLLENEIYRRYFDRFLQSDPADLRSLQCFLNTKRLLGKLTPFIICTSNEQTTTSSSVTSKAIPQTSDEMISSSIAAGSSSSIMMGSSLFSWRSSLRVTNNTTTNTTTTASSIKKPITKISTGVDATNNVDRTRHPPDTIIQFVDAFEVFKMLLFGLRSLQKEFFPSMTNIPITRSTTVAATGNNNNNNKTSKHSHYHKSTHNTNTTSSSSSFSFASDSTMLPICAGLSERLRVEISATLTQYMNLQSSTDIDSLDRRYVFSSAKILYDLICSLEQETYHYLQSKFQSFQHSDEYSLLIALRRCESDPQVIRYLQKQEFFYEDIKRPFTFHHPSYSSHSTTIPLYVDQIVHWATPQAAGTLYLPILFPLNSSLIPSSSRSRSTSFASSRQKMMIINEEDGLNHCQDDTGISRLQSLENEDTTSTNIPRSSYSKLNTIDIPPILAIQFSACK